MFEKILERFTLFVATFWLEKTLNFMIFVKMFFVNISLQKKLNYTKNKILSSINKCPRLNKNP